MHTTQKRPPRDHEDGATHEDQHGYSLPINSGIVNPKRRERLARRLRRAEARLSRLATVRDVLAQEMAGMACGGAS